MKIPAPTTIHFGNVCEKAKSSCTEKHLNVNNEFSAAVVYVIDQRRTSNILCNE